MGRGEVGLNFLTGAPTTGATHSAAVRGRGVMRISFPRKTIKKMITHDQLSIGDKVKYDDGDEIVVAKVIGRDNEKRSIRFVDMDEFEWDEDYEQIPNVVKSIISHF